MRLFLLAALLLTTTVINAQQSYWQQELKYTITASLDDKTNSINGNETIVYKNNSPESLSFIWFHLWPNAYKDSTTALFRQLRRDSARAKKLVDPGKGYIDQLAFTVNGAKAKTEPHPPTWRYHQSSIG